MRGQGRTEAGDKSPPEGFAVGPPQDVVGDGGKPERLCMAGPLHIAQHQCLGRIVDCQGQRRIPASHCKCHEEAHWNLLFWVHGTQAPALQISERTI